MWRITHLSDGDVCNTSDRQRLSLDTLKDNLIMKLQHLAGDQPYLTRQNHPDPILKIKQLKKNLNCPF